MVSGSFDCDKIQRIVSWHDCFRGEWWSRIVLRLYYPDRDDSGTQHIILFEKAIRKWTIIYIAVPGDFNVGRTEDWKVEKYHELAFELKRIHQVDTSSHSTSCEWSTGNSTKVTHLVNWAFRHWWHHNQMTVLLGTAGILCRAMNLWTISHSWDKIPTTIPTANTNIIDWF